MSAVSTLVDAFSREHSAHCRGGSVLYCRVSDSKKLLSRLNACGCTRLCLYNACCSHDTYCLESVRVLLQWDQH